MIVANQESPLELGTIVFVLFDDKGEEKSLIRGVVVEAHADSLVAEFQDRIHPTIGLSTHVSCHLRKKFVTARAKVVQFLQATPRPHIRFMLESEFKSVEQRQYFRVSVAGADLRATVNGEMGCEVHDVGPQGLSVLTAKAYEKGDFLKVLLTYGAKQFSGTVMVQSVAAAARDRFRYGCQVADGENNLQSGLQQICTAVQREQIRRLRDKGIEAA